MAADMFRERGWRIDLETGLDHEELVELATKNQYPLVGLSASSDRMVVPLTRLIASLRVTSPVSAIMVSGELTTIEPDLAAIVDADFIPADAPSAIDSITEMLASASTSMSA